MKKDGQKVQMTFSFPPNKNLKSGEACTRNVVSLSAARQASETSRAKSREAEVVNKILRASKTLDW